MPRTKEETPDTKIVIKTRNVDKNSKKGQIIDLATGKILFEFKLPTFRHVSRALRETGLIPASLVINKKGETLFKRTNGR